MTTTMLALPDDLRARWPHTLRLAWVLSRAFGVVQRPGLIGDVWAAPTAILLYLPIVLAATLTGRAATNKDRTAVLIVYPSRSPSAAVYLIGAGWLGGLFALILIVFDLMLSRVTTRMELGAMVAAWLVTGVATGTPAFANAAALVSRGLQPQPDALLTSRHAAKLHRDGKLCGVISAWAAWPPHRGAGRRLADDLLRHLPTQTWLVATARDTPLTDG